MDIKFLGQGFEDTSPDSVGNNLISLFKREEFEKFTAITAFLSLAGVNGLAKLISEDGSKFSKIIVITGVDQKGTSKEALEALLKLGVDSYVFYQPGVSIFHPKVYFFEGKEESALIVGSSNLTAQGLFVNVEASLLVNVNHESDDGELIKEFKDYYDGLYNLSDPNLQPLTDLLIQNLVSANIVPTESERRRLYAKNDPVSTATLATGITGIFPRRSLAKIPSEFKTVPAASTSSSTTVPVSSPVAPAVTGPATSGASAVAGPVVSAVTPRGQLAWIRKRLPASSVQQSAAGTNPTGGLRLVQDDYTVGGVRIDQTSYFRNTLFGAYSWRQVRATPFVEAATIPFEIIIRGANIGVFSLDVRHKPSGSAGQGNYTTSISWGTAVNFISAQNLTGFRLELYEPIAAASPFQIVIN